MSGAVQPQNAGAIHPYKKSASCGRRRNAQKNVNLGSPFTTFKGGKFEQPSAVRIARLKFMDLSDSPLLQIIIRNPGPAFFSALGRRPHCGRRRNAQKNVNLGSPFTSFKGGKFEQPSAVRIARLKFMDLSDSPLLQIIIRNPGPAFFSALGRRPHEAHFL